MQKLTIIMVLNLVLVLFSGVREDVRNELGEDVVEKLRSEGHLGEVEAVVKGLEDITYDEEGG